MKKKQHQKTSNKLLPSRHLLRLLLRNWNGDDNNENNHNNNTQNEQSNTPPFPATQEITDLCILLQRITREKHSSGFFTTLKNYITFHFLIKAITINGPQISNKEFACHILQTVSLSFLNGRSTHNLATSQCICITTFNSCLLQFNLINTIISYNSNTEYSTIPFSPLDSPSE